VRGHLRFMRTSPPELSEKASGISSAQCGSPGSGPAVNGKKKLNGKEYDRELRKLQTELVEMQEWVKATGARIVVVFVPSPVD
jgi:polyphosphate kinase